jgi:hypothetical protein
MTAETSCWKLETKLSKIDTASSGTKAKPDLANNLTKIGSTLSPEEHRLHAWGRSALAGFTT